MTLILKNTSSYYILIQVPSPRRASVERSDTGVYVYFPAFQSTNQIHFTITKVPRFDFTSISKVSFKTLVKSINADKRLGDLDYRDISLCHQDACLR